MYLTDWWTNRQTGEQTDRQWWMDLLTWLTIKVTDSLPLELIGTLSHDWLSNWLMTDCQSEWLSNRLSRWLRAWFIDVWLTVLLLPLQQFSTIIELVDYYSQHPVDLKSGGSTCLTAACPVRLWSTDSGQKIQCWRFHLPCTYNLKLFLFGCIPDWKEMSKKRQVSVNLNVTGVNILIAQSALVIYRVGTSGGSG